MESAELRIENEKAHPAFRHSQFSILIFVAAILLLAGHFLPWAAHPTSALTQSGHELAFSTNFTPGAGVFANEWFFVPAWCAALLLAVSVRSLSLRERAGVRALRRIVFGGIALVIASLGFPPYPQVLSAFRAPDFQVQFFVTLGVMAGVIALLLTPAKHMPVAMPVILLLACGLLSLVPVLGFLAIKPALETLYGGPVGLGAGWWLTLIIAGAATGAGALASAKMPRSSRH
jgi:hypothetical protein